MTGFNVLDMLNRTTIMAAEKTEEYKEITLDIENIIVTNHNKYSMDEIQELATGILLAGGLQQPIAIGRVEGEYRLISGHRRREALLLLIAEGNSSYRNVPCRYKDMTELNFRIELLCGNTFNRKLSDHDLMIQAQEWKEVLQQARKEGSLVLEKGKRVRDYVAAILGESTGKIGQLEAINNNAVAELKEQMQEGNIGVTSAYMASQLPEEQQKDIAERVEDLSLIHISYYFTDTIGGFYAIYKANLHSR